MPPWVAEMRGLIHLILKSRKYSLWLAGAFMMEMQLLSNIWMVNVNYYKAITKDIISWGRFWASPSRWNNLLYHSYLITEQVSHESVSFPNFTRGRESSCWGTKSCTAWNIKLEGSFCTIVIREKGIVDIKLVIHLLTKEN